MCRGDAAATTGRAAAGLRSVPGRDQPGRVEQRDFGPRKRLLDQMLREPNPPIRTLTMLRHVTGTTDDECRRLLIEIGARGVVMRGGVEGWALIDRYGFSRPAELNEDPTDA